MHISSLYDNYNIFKLGPILSPQTKIVKELECVLVLMMILLAERKKNYWIHQVGPIQFN